MERWLKPLDQLCVPDSRHGIFVLFDSTTGKTRPRTIEDHYAIVKNLNLGSSVPEEIRAHFAVACNLLLYAWYVYEFIPVAEMHAFASLEFALKIRTGNQDQHGLKRLLNIAVKQGWIRNEPIRQYQRIEERRAQSKEFIRVIQEIFGDQQINYEFSNIQSYVSILSENIPWFRNKLAHGSGLLHPVGNAYLTLEICCDLIDQLFPTAP